MTFLVFVFSFPAQAIGFESFGPFSHRIQNPLYLQLVDLLPETAQALPKGTLSGQLDTAFSNIFERSFTNSTDATIDMELFRVTQKLRYGLGNGFEVGVEIPWIHMEGGFLDPFIQWYHHALGVPNGGRNRVANNQFRYQIDYQGTTLYQTGPEAWNIGDITFVGKKQFQDETNVWPAMALRFAIKAPTGDRGEGLGGGNPGFAFGLDAEKSVRRLHGYLNTFYALDQGNDLLGPINRTESLHWSLAGEFNLSQHVATLLQLVSSTPVFHSTGQHVLDEIPLDMILGFRGEAKKLFWQAGFSEDVTSRGPSVDFTLFTSIGYRWKI